MHLDFCSDMATYAMFTFSKYEVASCSKYLRLKIRVPRSLVPILAHELVCECSEFLMTDGTFSPS